MNTEEIEKALKDYKPLFLGVFSSDKLPTHPHGLFISNTDPSHLPGTHWVAICIDGRRGEYFDSFGRPPSSTFKDYMNTYCKHWTFNARQLQSIASSFCGQYCIYYCIMRSFNVNMCRIVNNFTKDTGFNDVLVHSFVCENKI